MGIEATIKLAAGSPDQMRNLAEWLNVEGEGLTHGELLEEAADLFEGRLAYMLDCIGRGEDVGF